MTLPPTTDAERPATDANALDRLKRFGGPALLREMIVLFLTAAPERIGVARAAAAAGDRRAVERALHALKSSSAQLGAMRMQRLSEQGEAMARDGVDDGIAEVIGALEQELLRVHEWLTSVRNGETA
jgi:HPt (histidine-containing phosphotransfer) domain-containing protein